LIEVLTNDEEKSLELEEPYLLLTRSGEKIFGENLGETLGIWENE